MHIVSVIHIYIYIYIPVNIIGIYIYNEYYNWCLSYTSRHQIRGGRAVSQDCRATAAVKMECFVSSEYLI